MSQNAFVARVDAKEGAQALIEKRAPNFKRLGKRWQLLAWHSGVDLVPVEVQTMVVEEGT
ncbi:MAG: hypothetical protein ACNYPE_16230 [Candidatus Azotimanducaceae bacterium WSBS_2022_MAG_OTU7]